MNSTQFLYRNGQPNYNYPQYGHGPGMSRMYLKVIMCCEKCEEKVKEEIEELDGVQDVFTDQMRSSVVVHGYANDADVVRKAKKVDRKAELLSVRAPSSYDDRPQYYRRDSYIAPRGSYPYRYDDTRRDSYRSSYMDNRLVYETPVSVRSSSFYRPSEYRISAYRPSQDYPSRYDFDPISDYYDSGMITNPNYIQHVRYA